MEGSIREREREGKRKRGRWREGGEERDREGEIWGAGQTDRAIERRGEGSREGGRGRDMVWQIKEERGAAANCSPYDASLGLRAADSAC